MWFPANHGPIGSRLEELTLVPAGYMRLNVNISTAHDINKGYNKSGSIFLLSIPHMYCVVTDPVLHTGRLGKMLESLRLTVATHYVARYHA